MNFSRSVGGRYDAPDPTTVTELRSVVFHAGWFTNWWIAEGTNDRTLIWYLAQILSGDVRMIDIQRTSL